MDIQEHVNTFAAFNAATKWGSLVVSVVLLMLVLWFCTSAGFLGGLIAGLVVAAAGVFFLRDKPGAH